MPIVPARAHREWMDLTHNRFANRCLPLLIANQAGWLIINMHHIRMVWDGREAKDAVSTTVLSGPSDMRCGITSHFGSGIVTWNLNYLFRTPPGWNLWVKGPSNWPKVGITPLEGIVETDWAVATFTMNWKMTSIDLPVYFEPGEPICMIVPLRRGDVEQFAPECREISDDPELKRAYESWSASRSEFNKQLEVRGSEAEAQRWQKHYFQGAGLDGTEAAHHQSKLDVKEFAGMDRQQAPNPRSEA
jgi:hypothetical protein